MTSDATSEELRSTLEILSDRSVPGVDRLVIGSWRARAGCGVTGRANSTWAPGPAGCPVSDAVDDVEAWYRSRDLPPRFQIFDGADHDLVAELDARGWIVVETSLVMVADLDVVIRRTAAGFESGGAEPSVTEHPTTAFETLVGDGRRMTELTAADLPRRFVTVIDGADRIQGGGMTTLDGPWMAVQAMKTVPEARRQGVASAVIAALARAAADAGVQRGWLQVAAHNDAAVALYRKLGFETMHGYRYHEAPGPEAAR